MVAFTSTLPASWVTPLSDDCVRAGSTVQNVSVRFTDKRAKISIQDANEVQVLVSLIIMI